MDKIWEGSHNTDGSLSWYGIPRGASFSALAGKSLMSIAYGQVHRSPLAWGTQLCCIVDCNHTLLVYQISDRTRASCRCLLWLAAAKYTRSVKVFMVPGSLLGGVRP